jgi:hypothetical protein
MAEIRQTANVPSRWTASHPRAGPAGSGHDQTPARETPPLEIRNGLPPSRGRRFAGEGASWQNPISLCCPTPRIRHSPRKAANLEPGAIIARAIPTLSQSHHPLGILRKPGSPQAVGTDNGLLVSPDANATRRFRGHSLLARTNLRTESATVYRPRRSADLPRRAQTLCSPGTPRPKSDGTPRGCAPGCKQPDFERP